MIQIIKRGSVPKYRVTCSRCGTVFSCESIDLETDIVREWGYIDCPLCSDRLMVDLKKSEEKE